MAVGDWGIAAGVAASVLLLEEGRKLALAALERLIALLAARPRPACDA